MWMREGGGGYVGLEWDPGAVQDEAKEIATHVRCMVADYVD